MKIKMQDIYDLEDENLMNWDIGYRGGTYGISVDDFLNRFMIDEDMADLLPNKIGAYCNYLGGGLRGSVCVSSYSEKLPKKLAKIIDEFTELCRQRYLEIENEMLLNDEGTEDDPNWDAMGTNASRRAGIISSY